MLTVDLLTKTTLSASEQMQIEQAIAHLAEERRCSRARAAQLPPSEAFPVFH